MLQKQVEKRTKSKQTSQESLDSPDLKSPAGRGGGGGASRGRGTQRSTRTSAALAQKGITATGLQEKTEKQKAEEKGCPEEEVERKQPVPIVECSKLIISDLNTPSCMMPQSQGYKHLLTARRGTPYKGPAHGSMPLDRSHSPQNLGNLKNAPGTSVNEDDFMNKNLEVVEEQLYSNNIIPNAEINIETDMGYEEWCAAEGLIGL